MNYHKSAALCRSVVLVPAHLKGVDSGNLHARSPKLLISTPMMVGGKLCINNRGRHVRSGPDPNHRESKRAWTGRNLSFPKCRRAVPTFAIPVVQPNLAFRSQCSVTS